MFSSPVRTVDSKGNVSFQVLVTLDTKIQLEVSADHKIQADMKLQPRFRELQKQVLSELVKQRSIFKTQPTVESLEAITPNWGFIILEGKPQLSPYTKFQNLAYSLENVSGPCVIDLQLFGIEITRSSICPIFEVKNVTVPETVIDFNWGDKPELEEISDVAAEVDDGVITLTDPAVKAREKAAAKSAVRAAFHAAEEARANAQKLANEFLDAYDLSDSESAFSEWMSESEDEDE